MELFYNNRYDLILVSDRDDKIREAWDCIERIKKVEEKERRTFRTYFISSNKKALEEAVKKGYAGILEKDKLWVVGKCIDEIVQKLLESQ